MSEGGEGIQEVREELGVEGEGEIDVTSVNDGGIGDDEEIQEEITPGKDETTASIVQRSYEALRRKGSGGKGKGQDPSQAQRGFKEKAASHEPEVLTPPQRLTFQEKEIFGQMPLPLQKAVHEMFRNHEGLLTRTVQQARAAEREAGHIIETVRPYIKSRPELMEQGITESKLVGALLAAHEKLTNPQTAMQTWLEIGAQVGVDPEKVKELLGGQGMSGPSPEIQALQGEIQRLQSIVYGSQAQAQQQQQQQRSQIVERGVSEMEALREQRDAAGRYLYPKLHDDNFLQETKPLVAALARKFPDEGYGALLKRAHDILLQMEGGQAPQPDQRAAGLPQQRPFVPPSAPGVSVRGRSAPPSAGMEGEIPEDALKNTRSAVEWAYKHLQAGGS